MFGYLRPLAVLSVTRPRDGIAAVQALGVDRHAALTLAAFGVIAEAIVTYLMAQVVVPMVHSATGPENELRQLVASMAEVSPMTWAMLGAVTFGARLLALVYVGRGFGGSASTTDCILAIGWFDVLWVGFSIVATVLLALVPLIAGMIFLAGGIWSIYVMIAFVAEIHRFQNMGQVAIGVVVTYLLMRMLLGFLPI